MPTTLKAVVRYDGTDFAGWQVQPGYRTVQGELEGALSKMASRRVVIHGSGRTDAGVHALGQVFSCRWPEEAPDCARLRRALSGMLGPEIRVTSVEPAPDHFHAQRSAVGKRYAYVMSLAREPDPFSARYAWCHRWGLDLGRLERLSQMVVGTHDFAGFQSSGSSVGSTVRTLFSVELKRGGVAGPCDDQDLWRLEFHGNGFLYKMVRNLVGALVDVARNQRPETFLHERLIAAAPYQGHTAPARGLFLMSVDY